MPRKPPKKKPYNGRDYFLLEIIKGATKAGVHKDRKKERKRKICREKVKDDNSTD